MISLFTTLLANLECYIETAGVYLINGFFVDVGALFAVVLALTPSMPTMPTVPTQVTDAMAYANYYFPLGYTVDLFTTMLALTLAWYAVSVALRWLKVVE